MKEVEGLPERLTDQCADAGSLPALAGWRPIETVPEGEHVLLWFQKGERGNGGMECATIFRDFDGGLPSGGWTHGGPNSGSDWEWGRNDMPSHWMSLPPPPVQGE